MRRRGALYPVPGNRGRLPREKKRGQVLFRILAVLIFSLFLWGGHALCTVRDIQVSGCSLLAREEILTAAGVQSGRSIWLINPARAAARVEELPRVRRAEVERSLPWSVYITVEERKPAAVVPAGDGFWTVDCEGVIIDGPAALPGDLPVVMGLDGGLDGGHLSPGEFAVHPEQGQALERLLRALDEFPGLEVSELNVRDPGELFVFTLDGLKVLLGDSENLETKLELLWQSMSYWSAGDARCVDVRLADRLVISP